MIFFLSPTMSTSLPLVRNVCDYNWSFFSFYLLVTLYPENRRARDIIIINIIYLCLFLRLRLSTGGVFNNCTIYIHQKDAPLYGIAYLCRIVYRVDIHGISTDHLFIRLHRCSQYHRIIFSFSLRPPAIDNNRRRGGNNKTYPKYII